MFDREGLKTFIRKTLEVAYGDPKRYPLDAVCETIFYRIDLMEDKNDEC